MFCNMKVDKFVMLKKVFIAVSKQQYNLSKSGRTVYRSDWH